MIKLQNIFVEQKLNILELSSDEIKFWSLFAHFYEKGFKTANNNAKADLIKKELLKKNTSPVAQKAIEYFYKYRINQLKECTSNTGKTMKLKEYIDNQIKLSLAKTQLVEAKRKLSPLQKHYANFFLSLLDEYEIDSPAELDDAKKIEFFNRIKKEWKKEKKEFLNK